MAEYNGYDVIVVGAGNAATCAALSAKEQGARVLMLEKAPFDERGGNSLFTAGGFRFVHDGLDDLRTDILDDLTRGRGRFDRQSADAFEAEVHRRSSCASPRTMPTKNWSRFLLGQSRDTMRWMRKHKLRFIPMFGRQSLQDRWQASFLRWREHRSGRRRLGPGRSADEGSRTRADRDPLRNRAASSLMQNQKGAVTGVRAKGPDGFAEIPLQVRGPRLRRIPGQSGNARALFRPRLGAVQGAWHPLQHRRRHQRRARDRRAAVWRLVDLPRRAVGHQRAAFRRSRDPRQLSRSTAIRSASSST